MIQTIRTADTPMKWISGAWELSPMLVWWVVLPSRPTMSRQPTQKSKCATTPSLTISPYRLWRSSSFPNCCKRTQDIDSPYRKSSTISSLPFRFLKLFLLLFWPAHPIRPLLTNITLPAAIRTLNWSTETVLSLQLWGLTGTLRKASLWEHWWGLTVLNSWIKITMDTEQLLLQLWPEEECYLLALISRKQISLFHRQPLHLTFG